MSEQVIIDVMDVNKTFQVKAGEVTAVDSVSFTAKRGEVTTIVGPSGSGKTTLLYVVGSLEKPESGSIEVAGNDILDSGTDLVRYRRENVGFVFQFFNLVPTLTALENVMLAGDYAGMNGSAKRTAARGALELVGLADRADHRPAELSGGEQQRVAIARALACTPELILADEPTGNLDSDRTAEVLALLRTANREHGRTIVLVTHDPEVGAACDRIVRMRDGRVRDAGTARSVPAAAEMAVPPIAARAGAGMAGVAG